MILNKKEIDSSIITDKELWLYNVNLPWINRYFESVYYSFEGKNKWYWNLVTKFNNKNLNNQLVWISRFNNHYVICFIDLNNLSSKYYFVKSFEILEVSLEWVKYDTFIYRDFENNLKFIIDYKWDDFAFDITENKFIILNTIFWSEAYSINYSLDNFIITKKLELIIDTDIEYLDIADFFIYDDFFTLSFDENFNNFSTFLWLLNNKSIKGETSLTYRIKLANYNDLYSPKIKINLAILSKNIEFFKVDDFRNLLLCFFWENISCYLINNEYIEKYFSNYFNDFTKLEFDEIDLDFNLPDDIFSSDKAFKDFKLDLLKLRYNLFLLKTAYNLKDIKSEWWNSYLDMLNNRLNINKESLEKTISSYEKILTNLLYKI